MSARLARTARGHVEERFSLERYVDDLDSWLREIKNKGALK
jgi:alpha-beta hydrolase superfamily lysophospholipase